MKNYFSPLPGGNKRRPEVSYLEGCRGPHHSLAQYNLRGGGLDADRQYHKQRNELFREILRDIEPLARKLPEDFEPFCHNCGVKKSEANELHLDHPNGNPEDSSELNSGWDYYYMYRRQHRGGVKLWPLCVICHYLFHRTRDDDGDTSLANHRKYLKDYESVDPDLELARRREEKQERLVECIRDQESMDEEPENGQDRIMMEVREILETYAQEEGQEIDDVIGFVDADEEAVKSALNELKREGEAFEPQAGKIMLI